MTRAWWVAVGIGAVVVGLLAPTGVEANRPAEQLGLARICVSEAGWVRGPDCPAILAVLRSRAERMDISLYQAMRAYSGRTFSKARTDARRWIADLQWHAGRPDGWPSNVPWETYRPKWEAALDRAGGLLSNDEVAPCDPHHWGDKHGDRLRALRAGWSQVDCGDSVNLFWRTR